MPSTEDVRKNQRRQWGAVADGWEKWGDWNERSMLPITSWLCRAVALTPGSRLLDVACGSGQPALSVARLVRPGGEVVAIDLSTEMLAAARRRARRVGLDNLTFHEMDAEHLGFADGTFGAVTCAFGLMFCPDPARAVAEIHRVLEPGGRFAVAVWDEPARNPFFSTVGRAFAQLVASSAPPPDPKAPGGFRFAPPGELEAVLRAGGFTDLGVERRPFGLELQSFDDYWQVLLDMAAGLTLPVASLSAVDQARLRELLREAAQPHFDGEALHFTATALCASGRKHG